eukprot:CAMPEP_0202700976 /NCGR_PEP_ID=MMETSP1385-20130828/14089_1 /ASSEMBLY_ACC=CAM_ASM_000861 /TAXON_ID=933848 /ORGANISM="Elphidium margaritaceum" /LENGTH=596 /DNA_ID=CAMNT_0049358273 /DNA_START=37 /DNA_END=1824 /DNA_ORIENTATION=-
MSDTNDATQPFLSKDAHQKSSSSDDDLAMPTAKISEEIRQAQDDGYRHSHSLTAPPSPPSHQYSKGDDLESSLLDDAGTNTATMTLSKKLFNISHTVMIPLMFLLSFFVYYDRGALASSLDAAQKQLLHGDTFLGNAVASCYLFGYCISSPMFAVLGAKHPPLRMSAVGMTLWCLGTFLTGWPGPHFVSGFVWLALARLLTGIGEASFLAFAGTIIDIIAPDTSRSLWLGTFYMGIPLGYAMGYAVGGTIADMNIYVVNDCDSTWFDDQPDVTNCNESWRATFISETFIVLPLCVVLYCIQQPPNMLVIKQAKDELDDASDDHHMQHMHGDKNIASKAADTEIDDNDTVQQKTPVSVQLIRLFKNRVFVATCLGYALQTFVTGTFAVDAIQYLQNVYGWNSSKAGTSFGIITFVSGVAGSVFGGLVLDKLKSRLEPNSPPYMYCRPALKLLVVLSFLSFPFAFIVVLWNKIPVFIIGAAMTEFLVFTATGPVNNVILWCVLYEDRPLAAALNTLVIHALGDACAPLLVGGLVKAQTENGQDLAYAYNFAFGVAVFWLIFSGIAFIIAVYCVDWLEDWMHRNNDEHTRKPSLLINDP